MSTNATYTRTPKMTKVRPISLDISNIEYTPKASRISPQMPMTPRRVRTFSLTAFF